MESNRELKEPIHREKIKRRFRGGAATSCAGQGIQDVNENVARSSPVSASIANDVAEVEHSSKSKSCFRQRG